ncbi:uncharacterized protein LOC119177742 isoform X2 [Rhipicephalus microplus]|uniref:uncharacterized protein LOC119177742 isoform X2 n=1 Tax=Rhipicephalus microplus TaxID=6941 RepID=UPI00188915FF|nr:POU domain, class 6, transcription factor 1-like isoform X1 [Rhipicephalus microplus]
MQPVPRQLVALASHQEVTKRHNDPLQSQQANGVHFLKTSMGTTLMGSAGQPSIFSVAAGIAPSAASMQSQQLATLLPGQQFLGTPPQGATFVQGHQASPVGVMVASRGTHTGAAGAFQLSQQLVNSPAGATAQQVNSAQQIFLAPQPQSTQVLLSNPSPLSTGHLLGQLLPLGAGGSQQVVQVVAANGTVLTTTLANLPALSQQLSLAAALASASSNAASKQQAALTMPHHFQQVAHPQQQQQQPHNGHVTMAAHQQLQQPLQQQQQLQQLFAAAPSNFAAAVAPGASSAAVASVPQLYANINGQLVAVSPQVLGQPMPGGQLVLQPQGLPISPMLMLNTAAPAPPTTMAGQHQQHVMVAEEEDVSDGEVKEEDDEYQTHQAAEDMYSTDSPRDLAEPQDEEEDSDPTEILGMSAVSPSIQSSPATVAPAVLLQGDHIVRCTAAEAPALVSSPPIGLTSSTPVGSALVSCPPRLSIAPASSLPVSSAAAVDVPASSSGPKPEGTISHTSANMVDGIDLEEIKHFAKAFKLRRLSLGLTQTQVGLALTSSEGPSYSQSAICRFEKLDITPKSAQKIKPVLERWMREAEERLQSGGSHALADLVGGGGIEPTKKRKQRTSFTPQALEVLNHFFEKSTHPTGAEMTELAEQLNYDREVVRVWFCNKRQAFKNTVKRLKTAAGVDGLLPPLSSDATTDSVGSAPSHSMAENSTSLVDCGEGNSS